MRHQRHHNLSAFMAAHHLTQEQLADLLGVSQAHISKILAGKVRPSLALAVRITKLGVPLSTLIDLETVALPDSLGA